MGGRLAESEGISGAKGGMYELELEEDAAGSCSASHGSCGEPISVLERGMFGAREEGPRHPGWRGGILGCVSFWSCRVRGELGVGLEQVLSVHWARIEGDDFIIGVGNVVWRKREFGDRGGANSH